MTSAKPTREQADLAEVLEMVLDKGIVINADIAITVGDTEMIGIELRAAIASFETAAEYGLAFPSGTDMRRVEQASGREPLESGADGGEEVDLGIDASTGGADERSVERSPPGRRPEPETPLEEDGEEDDARGSDGERNAEADASGEDSEGNAEADARGEDGERNTEDDDVSADESNEKGNAASDGET